VTAAVTVTTTTAYVVVPEGVDDASRPSGGNVYDRRITRGLTGTGWTVHEHGVPGGWPWPDAAACAALSRVFASIPDDAVVLVDGLIASAAAGVLVPESRRVRLVVLVHMPLGAGPSTPLPPDADESEAAVLSAASSIVTTSRWTRSLLLDRYGLPAHKVHVVEPGVDAADLAKGTLSGGQLLCVAAVTPVKGHDILVAALATLTDLAWRCACVGSLDRDPEFAARVRRLAAHEGVSDRVLFVGPQAADQLGATYAGSDLLVVASRAETYGMVVTEALARGLPAVVPAVGGLPESLGQGSDGTPPGLLVPVDDPDALAAALRRWLADGALRDRLRAAARERRASLVGWSATTTGISAVLTQAAA
jgi:glycosyltransferase involved in cell wall biosynthesis